MIKKRAYSPMELSLLNLVGRSKVTTADLVESHYGRHKPYHAAIVVASTMRSLIRKVKANHEKFIIVGSKAAGPTLRQFWREKAR